MCHGRVDRVEREALARRPTRPAPRARRMRTRAAKRVLRWAIGRRDSGRARGRAVGRCQPVDRPASFVRAAITDHFKYGSIGSEPGVSLLQPVGGVLPPYWVFTRAAVDLPRQAAGRLRLARLHHRARARAADRRLAAPAARHRSGRPELRRVPHRHGARHAGRAAAHRARHAGAPARSAGVRRVRARLHARQPGDRRQPCAAASRDAAGRRCSSGCCSASGLVDRLKLQTLELRNRIEPILGDHVPRWGRGRVDTFNPYKAIQFNWPLDALPASELHRRLRLPVALEPGAARGHAPALGRRQRFGGRAQPERGARRRHHAGDRRSRRRSKRVRDWIWTLPPPPYPFAIDRALAARGAALYRQHCLDVPRRPPLPRRREVGRACRAGRGDRPDRHRPAPARFVHGGVRREPVRPVPGLAVPVHALPQDQRLRQPAARRHLGARRRTCTTARCRRCAICSSRPSGGRPSSTAATTCSIRRRVGFVSDVAEADGIRFSRYDTSRAGQRQRRPRVRHDAVRRGQAGDRRVPEDVLIESGPTGSVRQDRQAGVRHACARHPTSRARLVPARALAGHRGQPGAGAADARRARADDRARRAAAGGAAALAAVRRLLLILLSVFYMPAAIDPDRYRTIAWLAVAARLAGVLFFLDSSHASTACSATSTSCSSCRKRSCSRSRPAARATCAPGRRRRGDLWTSHGDPDLAREAVLRTPLGRLVLAPRSSSARSWRASCG